ncbi:MAG: hypothetical protein A2X86_12960 [Bdellovibrionales bacterium GWA2_49_15]|nr:MAG: hypothetical protein A2X86_12960 [Bdellovibrionales bacterium GWA2_49_15]HAZ13895.1 hypothetical protein [Bdellovibrionales bacterium]
MKNLLCIFLVLGISACAFKSKDGANDPTGSGTDGGGAYRAPRPLGLDPDGDLDGDLVTNGQEYQLGRKPEVADLPVLQVAFLQNYKIVAKNESKSFTLDTKVAQNSPDFRYRVGSLFIRDHALETAASVGKFSTHTRGTITPNDLSWVKYPEIDQQYFQSKALEYQKIFGSTPPNGISLLFENNLRLKPSRLFPSIKNVVMNFYYYDYETENYRLLKQEVMNKNFMPGVNEVVTVQVDNVPLKLLTENYFKKGEFIISEIADFEIPEMGVTYKQLLASVKAKCLPIIINTPRELEVSYVGIGGGDKAEKTFAEVLSALYEKNYIVESNEVKKIGEFENNLPDFTYLKEVREKDKIGKWFILSSPFNEHYSDHRYTPQDHLILTYATGRELAQQTEEKLHGIWDDVSGGDSFIVYPFGTLSPNSEVHLELYPGRVKGERLIVEDRDYHERPGSCGRNCISGILEMDCMVKVNFFQPFDEALEFKKSLEGEISALKIVINKEDFPLRELLEKKAVTLSWNSVGHLHIAITDPSLITELHESEENLIALKVETKSEVVFQGAKLYSVGGQHGQFCPSVLANATRAWRVPVSESSILIEQFRPFQAQGMIVLPDKTYYQRFNFAFSSLITNFHN